MRKVLGWVGRVLLTSGILLLLFVAYQLWGTGIYEARQQDQLSSEFDQTVRQNRGSGASTDPTISAPGTTLVPATTTALAPAPLPPNGQAVAKIDIPRIGVSKVVVEGIDVADLRAGPGRYPATALPGHEGNVGIAGHRTTYGAPFGDLDQLAAGDEISVTSLEGTAYRYRVSQDPFVVDPSASEVLLPEADPSRPGHFLATLTLTTCHPKYSAAERLIVRAALVLPPDALPLAPTTVENGEAKASIAGLEGDTGSRTPTVLWGLIAALVGGLWWFLFHRYTKWYVWIAGAIPFVIVLFVFYTFLERLLPSNY